MVPTESSRLPILLTWRVSDKGDGGGEKLKKYNTFLQKK